LAIGSSFVRDRHRFGYRAGAACKRSVAAR
jgi:hypothetical protein